MVKTFKEMTLQELMQVPYQDYPAGLLFSYANEVVARLEQMADKLNRQNELRYSHLPVHPDALKVTC